MKPSDDREEVDGNGGRVIGGSIGYQETNANQGGVGVLAITRLARSELDPGEAYSREPSLSKRLEDSRRIEPGSPDLLKRPIRSPTHG